MNSLYLKKIGTACFLFFMAAVAIAQSSPVVLSALKVTTVIDASSPELNGFFMEMNVTDPAGLVRLEVTADDGSIANTVTDFLPVQQKGDKVELVFAKYTVPFEGQSIRFFLKIRDQMKSPYHKIVIKASDKAGRITNSLVYDQFN